jgi:hypothetical protein
VQPTAVPDTLVPCHISTLPTDRRAVLHDTGVGIEQPHICCHFDCHVEINGPQDLPLTFMIYVPKGGSLKGRKGKEIKWPLQQKRVSAQSVTYELLESAPRILVNTMCN